MCYRIHTDSEKDVREQRLSSEKSAKPAQRKEPDTAPPREPAPESGVMASLRKLFAAPDEKTASPLPPEESQRQTMGEKRETEKVG